MMRTVLAVWLPVVTSAVALSAYADGQVAGRGREKNWSGTVTAVDPKEKTLKVKGVFLTKTFNVGESCEVSLGDGRAAALNELRPGQRVHVRYTDASGVFVANRIGEEKLVYTGTVERIDAATRTLTVGGKAASRTFRIDDECKVLLKDDKAGALADVQRGHTVRVTYEVPGGSPVAHRIEQKSASFEGTLTAIDVPERTVKAKHLLGSKRFVLADGCRILVNGNGTAELGDLRIGQRLTFSFDEVDGVNVVNRIASAPEPPLAKTAQAPK